MSADGISSSHDNPTALNTDHSMEQHNTTEPQPQTFQPVPFYVPPEDMEDDGEPYIPPDPGPNQAFVNQISLLEFEKEKVEYTKAAVKSLMESPEYLRKYTMCRMCWCSWYLGQFNTNCPECGGYAMERPCPICQGKCGRIWQREVDISHSQNEAHWDGECGLPWEEKQGYMMQALMDDGVSDDDVLEGLGDLSTS